MGEEPSPSVPNLIEKEQEDEEVARFLLVNLVQEVRIVLKAGLHKVTTVRVRRTPRRIPVYMKRIKQAQTLDRLRYIAEDVLHGLPVELRGFSPEDTLWLLEEAPANQTRIYRLLHELQVHQIELDLQYDELKQTQQQLSLAHAKYVELYDAAPVGYFTTTHTGQISEVNLTGAALLSTERNAVLQQNFAQFVLPEDQDIYYFHRRRLAQSQQPQICELRVKRQDGSHFYAYLQSTSVSSGATPAQYRTIMIDITDRVGAETTLRQSHAELEQRVQERTARLQRALEVQRVLSDVSSVLITCPETTTILPRIARLVVEHLSETCIITLLNENSRLEIVAVAHKDTFREDEVRACAERELAELGDQHPVVQVMRSQQTLYFRNVGQDHKRVYAMVVNGPEQEEAAVQSSIIVPLIARGRTLGAIALMLDAVPSYEPDDLRLVEELVRRVALTLDNALLQKAAQQARTAAEAALQMRDQVFRLVSHDLKSPLSIIQGYAHMLRRHLTSLDLPDREKLQHYTDNIESTVTRMDIQIEEMLDIVALEAGVPLTLRRSCIDLLALVRQTVENYQQTTDKHRFSIHTDMTEVSLYVDELRLERVLINLVSNAIKYSPEGGDIIMTLVNERRSGVSGVSLSVCDQGIGIPACDLLHIFEPFRRGSNIPKEVHGTGLGLVSARQIIEQHSGTISVTSQENDGSNFTIWLPLKT